MGTSLTTVFALCAMVSSAPVRKVLSHDAGRFRPVKKIPAEKYFSDPVSTHSTDAGTPDANTPWSRSAKLLRLGDIEIDLRYRTVSQDGVIAELHPRGFDLLLLFLRGRGVLQTRDVIFHQVWPGVVVEDATLTSTVWMLRRAIGVNNKSWIRTVAKQGYVFDPPEDIAIVEVASPERRDVAPQNDDAVAPSPAVSATESGPSRLRRRWPALIAVLAAILVAGVVLQAALTRRAHRVELVLLPSVYARDQPAWPRQVLNAWIAWQLRSLDEVNIVDDGDICDDCASIVALMAVDRIGSGTDGVWRASVRFRGPDAPDDIVRESTDEQLVSVLDTVARRAVSALSSSVDPASLPAMPLDASSAELWSQGLAAERDERWGEAAGLYARVLEKSPAFGYARVQLAHCLTESRQTTQAMAAADKASTWIDALPAPFRRALSAQRLFDRQDYASAADAYAALAKSAKSPRPDYRVAEARSLRLDGRTLDAADRLAGDVPHPRPLALRWLLERAEIDMANRDIARVVDTTAAAMRLADELHMAQPRARATLLQAEAQAALAKPLDLAEFEAAATVLQQGGNALDAERARAYGELMSATAPGPGMRAETYIANARMAGNGSLEIDALRRVAQYRFRKGDAEGAHAAYVQAGGVAKSTSGSRRDQQLVELDLLQDDTLRLAFASIDKRLASLLAQPLQGRVAVFTEQSSARMAYWRGDFAGALDTLQRVTDRQARTTNSSLAQAISTLGCLRASVLMTRGETALARAAAGDCRTSGTPLNKRLSDIIEAELAIYSGDPDYARRLTRPMLDELASERNQVFRWSQIQEVAPLVARLGDLQEAATLLDDALPGASAAGYTAFEADMRITRAEIALAQADPDRAGKELARAEAILPRDCWYGMRRIRTAHAVLQQVRGNGDDAAEEIERVHADAVRLGDVLAELRVHGLIDAAHLAAICSSERHERLLALSGMRSASDAWLVSKNGTLLPPKRTH